MAFCTACGSEVSTDARFCPSCGVSDPTGRTPELVEPASVSGLTSGLVWLMGIFAAGCAIATMLFIAERGAIEDVESGATLARLLDLEDAINNAGTASFGLGLLGIAIFVVLIVWTHRGYSNLPKGGVRPLRLGTGMAIGSWFIPFYNFGGPKQVINDIWRGSDMEAVGDPNWTKRPILGMSTVWWIMFLVGSSLAVVGTAMGHRSDDVTDDITLWVASNTSEALDGNAMAIVGYVLSGAASVVGAVSLNRIGRRHALWCGEVSRRGVTQSSNRPGSSIS